MWKTIAKATIKDRVTEFVDIIKNRKKTKDWQFFLITLLCICDVFARIWILHALLINLLLFFILY